MFNLDSSYPQRVSEDWEWYLKDTSFSFPSNSCFFPQNFILFILCWGMFFPLVMYGCESWTIKNTEHRRTDAFELWYWKRLFESPLNRKEIQPVYPKGDQSWVFIGRTDVEAETPILWPPHAKSWLIWKDPDVGKDQWQEEKGMTEDEIVGWHHWLNGHGFG